MQKRSEVLVLKSPMESNHVPSGHWRLTTESASIQFHCLFIEDCLVLTQQCTVTNSIVIRQDDSYPAVKRKAKVDICLQKLK